MTGDFVRVACPECENEQIVYDRAATVVECVECGEPLATPSGGRVAHAGEVVETVDAR